MRIFSSFLNLALFILPLNFLATPALTLERASAKGELCVSSQQGVVHGHALLYYRDSRTDLLVEISSTPETRENALARTAHLGNRSVSRARLAEFLNESRASTLCYQLSRSQTQRFWAIVGNTPEKFGAFVEREMNKYELFDYNCVYLVEWVFEAVTGENLKVRGLTHLGVTSPKVLSDRIKDYEHPFQLNGKARTFVRNVEFARYIGLMR